MHRIALFFRIMSCAALGLLVYPAAAFAAEITIFGFAINLKDPETAAAVSIASVILLFCIIMAGVIVLFLSMFLRFRTIARDGALSFGWNAVRGQVIFFGGITILYLLISNIFTIIERVVRIVVSDYTFSVFTELFSLPYNYDGYSILMSALGFLASTFGFAGIVAIALRFAVTGHASLSLFLIPPKKYVQFAAGMVVYILGLLIGFFLLLIPAAWFGSKYFFWPYIFLSKPVSVVEAFKESAAMTRGAKFEIFLFWFLITAITYAGVLVMGVGYLITFPLGVLASAYVYNSMTKPDAIQRPPLEKIKEA